MAVGWQYEYDEDADTTTIYWVGESTTEQSNAEGKITK